MCYFVTFSLRLKFLKCYCCISKKWENLVSEPLQTAPVNMGTRVTCCPMPAPEPTFSFLEVAWGSYLCIGTPWELGAPWKVLWVPWDRRSWDIGLPFSAYSKKLCVYAGTVSLLLPNERHWGSDCAVTRTDCKDHSGILSCTEAKTSES